MERSFSIVKSRMDRRSVLRSGLLAGGAAAVSAGLMGAGVLAHAEEEEHRDTSLTKSDVAILQFLAAAELIESDLWIQYTELGGVTEGTQNNYQLALQFLDGDGSQYIASNTLDEVSHASFLNAYLESKGAEPVNLDEFRTLNGSTAAGASDASKRQLLGSRAVNLSWLKLPSTCWIRPSAPDRAIASI